MTDDSDGPPQINRDDPAAVLSAYDQIIAKNKRLSADVESGEKELGRQLKEISKMVLKLESGHTGMWMDKRKEKENIYKKLTLIIGSLFKSCD